MTRASAPARAGWAIATILNDLFLLGMLVVIAGILTTAMVLQYAFGEIPCPLCLLQRVAMFGVAIAVARDFRFGVSLRNTGAASLFALFLLIVSVRQTLLDIAPRPGHEYVGSAVLGLHMPVWSVLIATALLAAFALKLAVLGDSVAREAEGAARPPALAAAGRSAGLYVGLYLLALCAINAISVLLQCGLSECHTMGYRLLGTLPPG